VLCFTRLRAGFF